MRARTIMLLTAAGAVVARAARLQGHDSRSALPAWEPRPLRRLAGWCPPVPRTRFGRVAAGIWAAPLTAFGLVVGTATGVRPARYEHALLFTDARGLPAIALRWRGFSAATLGHVIIARGSPNERLLQHELVHVRQCERLGPAFVPTYVGLLIIYGYRRHPLERAARLCAAATQRSP